MTVRRTIVLDEELDKQLERKANKDGKSKAQLINSAIQHYLTCKGTKDAPTLRQIIAKYESKCKSCGATIRIGSVAFWSKETIICMDCYVNAKGDRTLATKYMKTRELKQVIAFLRQQADAYAEQIEEYQTQIRFADLTARANRFIEIAEDYLDHFKDDKLTEALEIAKTLRTDWEELKAFITAKFSKVVKKKRVGL